MGIGDIFKPKWRHSNWEVRLKALEKIDDEEILHKLATEDTNKDVQKTALNKIKNIGNLIKILQSNIDNELIESAIKNLDIDSLLTIVRNEEHNRIALQIIRALEDQTKLAIIAKNAVEEPTRLKALERITDNALIKNIAIYFDHQPYGDVRTEALKRLNNDKDRLEVALNSKDISIALRAVELIIDKSLLLNLLRKDSSDIIIQEKVLEYIDDEAMLMELLISNVSASLADEILLKINSEKHLEELFKHVEDVSVKLNILKKIDDDSLVAKLALDSQYSDILYAILYRIRDAETLLKIIKRCDNLQTAVSKIKNFDRLSEIRTVISRMETRDEQDNAVDSLIEDRLNIGNAVLEAIKRFHKKSPTQISSNICDNTPGNLAMCKYFGAGEIYEIIKDTLAVSGEDVADSVCTYFVNSGVNINITYGMGSDYKSALMWAVENGDINTAIILLNNGASPVVYASNMCSPFRDAITADLPNKDAFIDLFLRHGANWDAPLEDRWSPGMGLHTYRDLAHRFGYEPKG